MALIELTTNLKSLKYEGPEKPLITKDINDPPKTGGIAMQANHRIDDLVRHTKLLTKKPGLKFLGNQALLAQTNIKQDIKAQKGKSLKEIAKAVGNRVKDTVINTVLATASILGQIPVNGTGTHLIRGLKPITHLKGGPQNGIATLAAPDGTIIPNGSPKDGLGSFVVDDNYQITSLGDIIGNTYHNGEKWIVQFGNLQRTSPSDYLSVQGNATEKAKVGEKAFPDNDGTAPGEDYVKGGSKLKDKKTTTEIKATFGTQATPAERTFKQRPEEKKDADIYSKQITVQGNKSTDKTREKREEGLEDKPDAVQALGVETATILGSDKEDIIPFEFNTFYPGNREGNYLYFRAFLNSFNDNYSGDWAGTKYIGRAEEVFNYQGFSRDISFDFKIAAFSKADIEPLYNKLNLLVGSTAPTYTSGAFMNGTLTKITIGDYLKQTSGYISGIGLSWDPSTPWELEGEKRLPHVLDVSVSFTPIHDFVPTANSTFIG